MTLYINTTKNNQAIVVIKNSNKQVVAKKLFTLYQQAEKLLPMIDKLLINNKIKLKDLKKIEVENKGGSFASLRVGVTIANSLGYVLGIPVIGLGGKTKIIKNKNNREFSIVEPIYDSQPKITVKKNIVD